MCRNQTSHSISTWTFQFGCLTWFPEQGVNFCHPPTGGCWKVSLLGERCHFLSFSSFQAAPTPLQFVNFLQLGTLLKHTEVYKRAKISAQTNRTACSTPWIDSIDYGHVGANIGNIYCNLINFRPCWDDSPPSLTQKPPKTWTRGLSLWQRCHLCIHHTWRQCIWAIQMPIACQKVSYHCWWKKSSTCWQGLYIPHNAWFLPSTVSTSLIL